jgi:hypothetical protein
VVGSCKHGDEPSGSGATELVKYALIYLTICLKCEPGISVSIVSGYGPDDRAIVVRSPAEAK